MNGVEVFVPLTKGYVTTIDIEDWDKIRPYKWRTQRLGNSGKLYAGRCGKVTILLHEFLLGKKPGYDIDHRDGSPMNNRRENLRYATRSQNCANQKIRSTNTSGFKGVNWKNDQAAWVARISVNYQRIHLGYFSTAEEAARAYDAAAQQYFGEFAKLNFPNR